MSITWPDKELLLKSAQVSHLAYKMDKAEERLKPWMNGYELHETAQIIFVEDTDKIPDYSKEKRIFFGFRGTKWTNFQDIVDDGKALQTLLSDVPSGEDGGAFHKGFKNRSRRNWEFIFKKLDEISKHGDTDLEKYEIILCGHSLGGAAAAVTYIRMKTKRMGVKKKRVIGEGEHMAIENKSEDSDGDIRLDDTQKEILIDMQDDFRCITFGSPTFGNEANKAFCDVNKFSKGMFHIIHERDPIPGVILRVSAITSCFLPCDAVSAIGNYKITMDGGAVLVSFDADAHSNTTTSIQEKLKSVQFTIKNFSRHKVRRYVDNLACVVNVGCTDLDITTRTNDDMVLKKKPYNVSSVIGRGAFGVVMKGRNTGTGELVAIKKIKCEAPGVIMNVILEDDEGKEIEGLKEIDNLLKLRHENVVGFKDYFPFQKRKIYLVFEFCPDGSLRSFILESKKGQLKEEEMHALVKQMLSGLAAMHDQYIIHRDIKPGNILVTKDSEGNPIYKFADLGSSTQYGGKTKTMTATGTKLYMSPEVFQAISQESHEVRLNMATDVFSVGAVCLFTINVSDPWNEGDLHQFVSNTTHAAKLPKRVKDIFEDSIQRYPDSLEGLIKQMVSLNRYDRPKAKIALSTDPYMQEYEVVSREY